MLNAEKVENIFSYCLLRKEEIKDGMPTVFPIVVKSFIGNEKFGIHPERLIESQKQVTELIDQLLINFLEGGGSPSDLCKIQQEESLNISREAVDQLRVLAQALVLS